MAAAAGVACAQPVVLLADALAGAAEALAAFDEPPGGLVFCADAHASLLDAYVVHMLAAHLAARGLRTGRFAAALPPPAGRVPAPLPEPVLKALRNASVTTFVHAAPVEGAPRYLAAAVYEVGTGGLKGSLRVPFRLSEETAELLTRERQRMSAADADWLELFEATFGPAEPDASSERSPVHVAEAEFLMQAGLWDAAAARFLRLAPAGPNGCFMRGVFASHLAGRRDEAIRLTEGARRSHPESGPLCVLLGWLNLRNGRRDDAVLWFEQARLSDMTREGLYRYAEGLMALERGSDEAAARLEAAAARLPDAAFVQLQLARYHGNHSRLQEAIAYYRRALRVGNPKAETWAEFALTLRAAGDRDGALAALRQAFAVSSGNVVINRQLAAALKLKGRHDDALEVLRRAAEAHPHEPAVLASYGDGALEMWRVEAAQQAFEDAVALRAELPYATVRLAAVLALQQQHQRARDMLQDLLARRPEYPPARIELGRLLGRIDQFDQAVAVLEAATVDPACEVDARLALAEVHVAAGRADQAVESAQIATSARPNATTYSALSRAFLAAGEVAKAESAALSALQDDTHSDVAHLALARALRARGQTDQAIAEAERALEVNPFCVDALELEGHLWQDSADTRKCVELWRRTLALNPWNADLHLNLAFALGRRLGDWEAAREHLVRYAELEDMRTRDSR